MGMRNGAAAAARSDEQLRVLVLVAHDRDRELFADQLTEGYDVVTAAPDDEWPAFDLCLVDSAWYPKVATKLSGRRAAAEPVQLPVLLLLRQQPTDTPWLSDALGTTVDDVVELPTGKLELDARVASLARDRSMSLALADQRDQLRLFQRAIDEASVGISIADYRQPDNPLVYVNEEFEALTGYDASDTIGRNCRFLQGPETDPEAVAELRRAIDAGEPTRVQLLNYRQDGTPFWNRLTVAPVRDEAGTVTHYVGFQEDVTEQVARKRELERFEAILQAAPDPVYALDTEGRFTLVNDALVELLGHDRESLVGAHVSTVIPEEDVARGRELIEDLRTSDAQYETLETQVRTADGVPRTLELHITLLTDEGGEVVGRVGVCRDVTELRESERRLSVFDRVLRHNLRNKMNIVLARAASIEEGRGDAEAQAEAIRQAGEELLTLSDRTRQFHPSIIPGEEPRPFDIAAVVHRIAAERREQHPDATISVSTPDTAPVRGHETLELALDELVENAIIHHDRGQPTVEIRVRTDADRVIVEVADDGPGLDNLEQIPLERDRETPLDHATGLGLWFVRWTVTNAGGEIGVEEREPRGSVVRLWLPRAETEAEETK
ncbi:MAG: PAS domain S-box protein [Haloglomus sp.]